jgi:hypothetical protein
MTCAEFKGEFFGNIKTGFSGEFQGVFSFSISDHKLSQICFHGRIQLFREGSTLRAYEIIAVTLSLADSAS